MFLIFLILMFRMRSYFFYLVNVKDKGGIEKLESFFKERFLSLYRVISFYFVVKECKVFVVFVNILVIVFDFRRLFLCIDIYVFVMDEFYCDIDFLDNFMNIFGLGELSFSVLVFFIVILSSVYVIFAFIDRFLSRSIDFEDIIFMDIRFFFLDYIYFLEC